MCSHPPSLPPTSSHYKFPTLSTSRLHSNHLHPAMEFGGAESFNLGSGFVSFNDPGMNNNDDDELGVCSDSSSSVGSGGESSDDEESSYKEHLERKEASQQVVPVRRGISKFYSGKSKSFTSLADAASSASVKEFAKPETSYAKKQSNPLARKIPELKQASSLSNLGGHFKKFVPINFGDRKSLDGPGSSSASPPFCLPPLHPQRKKTQNPSTSISPRQKCSPWRSFSVSDLQGMVHNA